MFELGSGYGYSTAWFARAVKENGGGVVTTWCGMRICPARARASMRAGLRWPDPVPRVRSSPGAARDATGPFDLIFNDIDKQGYPDSLPVIYEKLRPGGVLIVDNLLWHGRIFDPTTTSAAPRPSASLPA